MKKIFICCFLSVFLSIQVFSQGILFTPEQKQNLQRLAAGFNTEYQQRSELNRSLAPFLGLPLIIDPGDGSLLELHSFKRNKPLYYVTHNVTASQTISTHKLYPGGSAGLNLTGFGQTIGLWDGGRVRLTHQEFQGRAEQMDGAQTNLTHSTHVAATMIGGGFHPHSRGMAYEARLQAWEWNNDIGEMAAAAAQGLHLSSHSYGFVTGWRYFSNEGSWYWFGDVEISEEEDYLYGFYSSTSRDWDEVAYNAPYYLMVKSAGNDRGYGPPYQPIQHYVYIDTAWVVSNQVRQRDGGTDGFNCISHAGVSKNVLTVGAIHSIPNGYTKPEDVIMASFSAWGPTDDGRVKPDIVAKGVGTLSASAPSNTSYTSLDGTSMAAPSVAGSVALLNQLFQSYYPDSLLMSSTLKALIIHTADKALNHFGPDYRYGWGVMNTKSAAEIISTDVSWGGRFNIREYRLKQDSIISFDIESNGQQDLVITLAWNDPPGSPVPAQLNPGNLMLVNDLDVRVQKNQQTWMPFVLNPAHPFAPPIAGDNFRDNVEKIYIQGPQPGKYTITISHKGILANGIQDFSIILSGASPYQSHSPGIPYVELWNYDQIEESGWQASNIQGNKNWLTTLDQNLAGKAFHSPSAFNGFAALSMDVDDPEQESILVSPHFSFTGIQNPMLSFQHQAFAFPGNMNKSTVAGFFVEASTDGFNQVIIPIYQKLFQADDPEINIREWLPLTGLENKSHAQIRFRFTGQGKAAWKIDDLFIYDQQDYDVFPLFIHRPVCQNVTLQTVVPSVYLINRGDSVSQANINFQLSPGTYLSEKEILNLEPKAEQVLHFDPWTPQNAGNFQGSVFSLNENSPANYQMPVSTASGNFSKIFAFEKTPRNTLASFLLESPEAYTLSAQPGSGEVMATAASDTLVFLAVSNYSSVKTEILSYNFTSQQSHLIGSFPNLLNVFGMDWHEGILYLLSADKIYRIDLEPFVISTVHTLPQAYIFKGLAIDNSGTAYTIRTTDNTLHAFSRFTIPPSMVGSLNTQGMQAIELSCNKFTGNMYLICESANESTYLYQLDVQSGNCTPLYELPGLGLKSFSFQSPPLGTQNTEFTLDLNEVENLPEDFQVMLTGSFSQWSNPFENPFIIELQPSEEDTLVYKTYLELPYQNFYYKYFLTTNDTIWEWDNGPLRILSHFNNWQANDRLGKVIKTINALPQSHTAGQQVKINASMGADITSCESKLSFFAQNQPDENILVIEGMLENGLSQFSPILSENLAPGYYFFKFSTLLSSNKEDFELQEYFIAPAPLNFPSQQPNQGTQMQAYQAFTFIVNGGMPPLSFSISGGQLPSGLQLSPEGVLLGTPQNVGDFLFEVKVTDALGSYKTENFSISIAPWVLQLTTSAQGMGTIEPYTGVHEVLFGTPVLLKAQPDLYWEFDRWLIGNITLYQSEVWWMMQEHTSAVAVFKPTTATFSIEITHQGLGTSFPEKGTHHFLQGQTYTFMAWPEEGWEFEKWIINEEEITTSQYEVFLSQDMDAQAFFMPITSSGLLSLLNTKLEVFPNPVTTNSIIQIMSPIIQDISLGLYDLQGQNIWKWEATLYDQKTSVLFPSEVCRQGTYFLRMSSQYGTETIKVFVR